VALLRPSSVDELCGQCGGVGLVKGTPEEGQTFERQRQHAIEEQGRRVAAEKAGRQGTVERKARQTVNVDRPTCSGCSRDLKSTGSIFGSGQVVVFGDSVKQAQDDYAHFAGSICFSCRKVYCVECLRGQVDRCPNCHGEAKTAFKKTLRELARL